MIAEQYTDQKVYDHACEVLSKVRKSLLECADDATLDDVVREAEVSKDEYISALALTSGGSVVVLKREPNEQNINSYNPIVTKAWQANMDIQFVSHNI